MIIGMLFFDDSTETTFEQKIVSVAKRYNTKYSKRFGVPNCCYVNPSMLKADTVIDEILVKTSKRIMKDHFWIGNSENTRTH